MTTFRVWGWINGYKHTGGDKCVGMDGCVFLSGIFRIDARSRLLVVQICVII